MNILILQGSPRANGNTAWILSAILLLVGCCGDKQEQSMSITVNLRYTGTDGNARKFAEEMISSGTVDAIRAEEGNLRYEYYQSS